VKPEEAYKFKSVGEGAGKVSAWGKYRQLIYGDQSLGRVLYTELVMLLAGGLPGLPGLALRKFLYPRLFGACGAKTVFGRNVVLRHAHKIRLGAGVIIDDNVVLDAKGEQNEGITLGDGVYVGRNTIIYCKGGDIQIGDQTNISSNCQVFSSNRLEIGAGTVIGAYSYLLSGGEYDYESPEPFAKQSGMETKGPLRVGGNCWLGARITVLDGATVGDHCVLAAGAVVIKPVPPHSVAGGVPARVLKALPVATETEQKDEG
jgi:acetyltransferase-like isoleucine patch superfamily enzyme